MVPKGGFDPQQVLPSDARAVLSRRGEDVLEDDDPLSGWFTRWVMRGYEGNARVCASWRETPDYGGAMFERYDLAPPDKV